MDRNEIPRFDTDLERFAWLIRTRPCLVWNSLWRGVAITAAVIGIITAVYSCEAKAADPLTATAMGKMLGSFFGGGGRATREMQLLQQAEALLQTKAQLEMLIGFGLNNSPEIMAAITNIHGLLGQIEYVLGYDPSSVLGEIETRYPMEYGGGGIGLPEAIERQREWDTARYATLAESARVQAQVSSGIPGATARDVHTLNEAIASPGLRASQDAGNQLTASIAEELRKSQMLQVASMRAIEARELEEAAQRPKADAALCGFLSSDNYTSRACHGSD